jgi:hypothetical protein
MPLSADAQALLELILAKGQSYGDLAGFLDLSEEEVRARAREALRELSDGEDPDRNVALTDWLLGQADPIGRAEAARHLREDPEDNALAARLLDELATLAPGAELPRLPGAPSGGGRTRRAKRPRPAKAAPKKDGPTAGERLSSLSPQQTRLIVGLGSAAVILVVVVLAVTGAFSGDGDAESSAATGTETTETDDAGQEIQTVALEPAGGGDAVGTATFGIAGGSTAYMDLEIRNLEPAPGGKAYILWLLLSEDEGHPLTPFQVDRDGTFSDRVPIDTFLTQIAARTRQVNVSLAESEPLLEEVQKAVEDGTPIIPYTGDTVMSGTVESTDGGQGAGGQQGAGAETTPEP